MDGTGHVETCSLGRREAQVMAAFKADSGRVAALESRIATLTAENAALRAALEGLLKLRAETEMTYESAYHAMFKGDGRTCWEAAHLAVHCPLRAPESKGGEG